MTLMSRMTKKGEREDGTGKREEKATQFEADIPTQTSAATSHLAYADSDAHMNQVS